MRSLAVYDLETTGLSSQSDAIIQIAAVRIENGTILYEINGGSEGEASISPAIGKEYKEGERFCYLQNQYGQLTEVPACLGGKLVEICVEQGHKVRKGSPIAYIERNV